MATFAQTEDLLLADFFDGDGAPRVALHTEHHFAVGALPKAHPDFVVGEGAAVPLTGLLLRSRGL